MSRILSSIRTTDENFKKRYKHNKELVKKIEDIKAVIKKGGPKKSHDVNKERGKLFCRQRIEKVLDKGSPFLEVAPLGAYNMYGGEGQGLKLDSIGNADRGDFYKQNIALVNNLFAANELSGRG